MRFFKLFLKSAVITALCILIPMAFIFGFFSADGKIAEASGRMGGASVEYSADNYILYVRILGESCTADLSALKTVKEYASTAAALKPPEYKLSEMFLEYLEEKLQVLSHSS